MYRYRVSARKRTSAALAGRGAETAGSDATALCRCKVSMFAPGSRARGGARWRAPISSPPPPMFVSPAHRCARLPAPPVLMLIIVR